jgi:steroid delta-isomerase-like uncharacterized protein
MKKQFMILPFALILCFMVGCQDKEAMAELEEFKAQAALEEQNKALIKHYYDAWLEGDIETLKDILAPEYVWHTGSEPDFSLEETIEDVKKQMMMYSNRTYSVEELIAKGDKVIVRYINRGAHTGDIEGFPATGNKFEASSIEIIRIEAGKIVESWEAYDELGHHEQLGMELKPKEGDK